MRQRAKASPSLFPKDKKVQEYWWNKYKTKSKSGIVKIKEGIKKKKRKNSSPYALQIPMKNPEVKKKRVVIVHRNPTPEEKQSCGSWVKKQSKQKTRGIYCACARNKNKTPHRKI